jgi:LmbE family N-acetylglucosaminyl deacetylase
MTRLPAASQLPKPRVARFTFPHFLTTAALLGLLITLGASPLRAQTANNTPPDRYRDNNRPPDPRFKADILLVVAHPDDEVMATAYLARAIYDQHKRVAVVYQTSGDGGNNDVGPEQAAAMGDIRGIEARRAVGLLGITNVFFLGGHDTPSQNVLNSLERCSHGHCLDELVRIVRITRPDVILTWLPDFATGENHADHQASGVLATEAFDLAGDPTVLAEQVSPATDPAKNSNLTEALRPWQPQKIYYFYNPTHDIFAGQGPQYASQEVSPSQHVSYGTLAARVFTEHLTQGGGKIEQELAGNTLLTSSDEIARLSRGPVRFIFGKSLVPSSPTDDVFTGLAGEGIPFERAPGYIAAPVAAPTLEIGDPWSFYHKFWQAHGLDHLANIVPVEVSIHVGTTLAIPLVVANPSATAMEVNFSVKAPDGWVVTPVAVAAVAPHSRYYLRVQALAPATRLPGWQEFTVTATVANKEIGTVPLRAELSTGWVAPQ